MITTNERVTSPGSSFVADSRVAACWLVAGVSTRSDIQRTPLVLAAQAPAA